MSPLVKTTIKMQKFVLELHDVQVPDETMRMRVKRAGYSYKSNRPSPYKGDEELQEEFKKRYQKYGRRIKRKF